MEKIKNFLEINTSNGSGYGYEDGSGSGHGSGYEDGSGSGYGIFTFCNQFVYNIDSIPTIILSVRNNIAKGLILNTDLTTTSCYIVKQNNLFSHGKTLKEAFKSLKEKLYQDSPIEERVLKFKEHFPIFTKKYKALDLFSWHHILTGSCEMGRLSFASNHNIDLDKDEFTIYEFIDLTKDQYNGDNIKKLLI